MRQERKVLLLAFDVIIEIINFLNRTSALRISGTSKFFKFFTEKLPCINNRVRIIPELSIITMLGYNRFGDQTYTNETYAIVPGKADRTGYKPRIWRSLPLAPPPPDIVGFTNISLDFDLKAILRSSMYIKDIKKFFQNIQHLVGSSSHYLHVHFYYNNYVCNHNFSSHKPFSSKVSEIPEFNIFLDWLNLFDIGSFPFLKITSSQSILFAHSAHAEALLSLLLNSAHINKVKFLQIENNFYCWHHYPYLFPLQLSSVAKWLFVSEGPKVVHFLNEDNPGKLDCICPIDRFLIPMLKSLLDTSNWTEYSYLIIHPTCTFCFNFVLIVQHSQLSPYLNHILFFTDDYLAIWLHIGVEYTAEKFELIWSDNFLYIRRSSLYGPLQKELDPQYCTNYFETQISHKHTITANIKVNLATESNH